MYGEQGDEGLCIAGNQTDLIDLEWYIFLPPGHGNT